MHLGRRRRRFALQQVADQLRQQAHGAKQTHERMPPSEFDQVDVHQRSPRGSSVRVNDDGDCVGDVVGG